MSRHLILSLIVAALPMTASAGALEDQLARYDSAAKAETPA